jgi:uncharacterized protein YozE (UPF0346 family)
MSGFKAWLRTQTYREDAIGDLARDASQDHCWPWGSASLGHLEKHLEKHGAIPEALETLRRAWAEWKEAA